MFSARFQLSVVITRHVRQRMDERAIDDALLLDLIETGTLKRRDDTHFWLYRHYEGRPDNLLRAAAVIQQALVIKTVMHRFQPE